jgi:hypothetical protein
VLPYDTFYVGIAVALDTEIPPWVCAKYGWIQHGANACIKAQMQPSLDPAHYPFGNPDPALLRYAGGTPMTDVWFINKSLPHFDYATWRFVTNTLKQHLPGERIQWCK